MASAPNESQSISPPTATTAPGDDSGAVGVRIEDVVSWFGGAIWRLTAAYAQARADREDLYQEILVAIWRALPRFRGDSQLGTYVIRIAHNRGLTHRAHAARLGARERDEDPMLPDPAPGTDERLHREHQRARLESAIRRLSAALAQPVLMHLEGMSHAEIAAVLGITENAVAVRMNRARVALAHHLDGVDR